MSIHVNESAVVKEITTSSKGGASWCLAYNPNDTYADLGWTDVNDSTFHELNVVELPYAPKIMLLSVLQYNQHWESDGKWDGSGATSAGSGGHGCYKWGTAVYLITQGHKYKVQNHSSGNPYPTTYAELVNNLVKITVQKPIGTSSYKSLTSKTFLEYIIGHAY